MIQPLKIFSLNSTKPIQQTNNTKLPHVSFATKPDTFEKTVPQKSILAPAYVPFLGYAHDEQVRALGHIVCPCCGIEMMTQEDMHDVSKNLGCTSKEAVKTLDKYEKHMRPIEKECFNLLKGWSEEKPDANFRDLLRENKAPQLAKLQEKQNTILDTVNEISKQLSEKEQQEIQKVTDLTRKLVASDDKEIKFKRKSFIKDVEKLEPQISNKEVYAQIHQEAEKMPTSQNDVSAFVVKYSERSHKEIGERLVKLSVGTIEHIHPRSEGGRNVPGNYMLECGGCNHERQSIPLGDWVDAHPEMKENSQKYIDEVIKRINKGEMKGFSFYPEAVAKTLYHESNGKLNLKVEGIKANA
ncbi:hypothetical protein IKE67_04525 [bacterium]|nr:hypothetical protein [bacterium]